MKRTLAIAAVTACISLYSAVVVSQGQDRPSIEESAYSFRDGIFHAIEWKSQALVAAQEKGDAIAFKSHAADMANLASMLTEGFIPNSLVEGSLAKKIIWIDWEQFETFAANFENNVRAMAVDDYNMANFDEKAFLRSNCGRCHKEFKVRAAIPLRR